MDAVIIGVRILAPIAAFATAGMIFYQRIYPGRNHSVIQRALWLAAAILCLFIGVSLMRHV